MSDENDNRAAYLAGLRESSAHAAGAAAASARAPAPSVAPTTAIPTIHEHRKSTRFKCKGSARLQERGAGVTTWATFADISMLGCYVESAAPFSVGTRLNLRLEANGYRIETLGEVCVAYPGLGMGISFSEISDRDCEQLRELVRSISRPEVNLASRQPVQSVTALRFPITRPAEVLQSMQDFFANRHIMGRDDFLSILRKHA